ncbi:DUF4234 domain-containing protein [Candidatus Saccharibacteria bacterium]|nr:DUF4234 domain-containing protein [Candidatus Saccharibacteria bacterium]
MKNRNPALVALFSFLSFGIYYIYWMVQTKIEMNNLGAKIPTAWFIIVPFANIWWLWKWCEGVGIVSGDKNKGFMLAGIYGAMIVLGIISSSVMMNNAQVTQTVNPVTGMITTEVSSSASGASALPSLLLFGGYIAFLVIAQLEFNKVAAKGGNPMTVPGGQPLPPQQGFQGAPMSPQQPMEQPQAFPQQPPAQPSPVQDSPQDNQPFPPQQPQA